MNRKIYPTIIVILCVIFQAFGQNKRLLIENVTVIPLHINQVWENKDVIIEEGIITKIRTHVEKDTTTYDLGRINGQGKFLVPSYADAHAHLPEKENLENYFLMNLLNGVTTLRSMRGEKWHLEIDENGQFTPRLILGSPPISTKDSITKNIAEKLIAGYKKSGFDFVKVLSVKDKETFDFLAQSAKTNNFPLAGHCPSNVGIFDVCKSNVFQSIEHLGGFFRLRSLDEINKAIDLSIAKEVYHCPTLDWYYTGQVLEDSLRTRKGVKYVPKEQIKNWESKISEYYSESNEQERIADREKNEKQFKTRLNYLGYIYRQGGQLLLSPDASGIYGIPGFGVHTEMKHFSNAGISNYDILKATSYNLSQMFNTQNEWGTIRVGANSDLVLLNSNPLEKIENSQDINGIIFNGKFYSKEELEKKLIQ